MFTQRKNQCLTQLNVYTAAISSVNKIVINKWLRLNFIGFLMYGMKNIQFLTQRSWDMWHVGSHQSCAVLGLQRGVGVQ
jgi:hypothetical protein